MKRIITTISLAAALTSAATIRGKVAEDAGKLPAAKITIIDSKGSIENSLITDMEGGFTVTNLPVGTYTLRVSYLGYADKDQTITISSDDEDRNIGTILLSDRVNKMTKITVVGTMQRDQARAQMIQRNADQIKSVIASDRIGKLPDRNAAEAVQRVAGVSIEKDQGEGRFVAVRGLPKEWNSATLNGNRIPAAEEEDLSRGTAFDFFPTDLIEYIEVNKAFTPDNEMDAMGGSINYRTKTAPDEQTLQASVAGGLGSKSARGGEDAPGRGSVSTSLLYGNRFADGKLGLLVNGTYWRRAWATDNWENRIGDDGLGIYRTELRDYTGVRQTLGVNGAFDVKFNDDHKLHLLGMMGTLNDEELHYKHRLRYDKVGATSGAGRVEIQNIHNILITRFWGGELGSEHKLSDMIKLDVKLGHYENRFHYGDVPDSKDNSYFALKYRDKTTQFQGLNIYTDGDGGKHSYAYFDIDGGNMPTGGKLNTHLANPNAPMVNPNNVTFSDAGVYRVEKEEKDNIVAGLDVTITPKDALEFKVGGKFRDKERTESFSDEYYLEKEGQDVSAWNTLTLVDQPGKSSYLDDIDGINGSFDKVLEKEAISQWWTDNKSKLYSTNDPDWSAKLENGGANGRNYSLKERHTAGYAQGKFKPSDKISILAGARIEQTDAEISGYITEFSTTDNGGLFIESEKDGATGYYNTKKVTKENDYVSVLPAAHLKFSPKDRLNFRLAYSRTFARPSFGDIVPGGSEMTYDKVRKLGNPELEPTYSNNFDLMSEYFFKGVGYINGGIFFKQITDPVYYGSEYVDGWKEKKPLNGDDAWLFGFEIGASKKFDFIPNKILSGFGLEANYTFSKSEMTIPDGNGKRDVAIPRQADHLFNAALFYELGGFNARLATNFKGAFIMDHAGEKNPYANEYLDEYYDDYFSMDFSTSYAFNNKITLFAEVSNLLNTPMIYTLGDPDKERQIQTEYYGVKGLLGIKASLF